MTIVYFFLVYKNAKNVERTIRRLREEGGEDDYFFLHVDLNSKEDFSDLRDIPHVLWANKRFSTKWGSPNLAFAVANGLNELIKEIDFDYVILLSESDYPVKKANYIHKYLERSLKDHILTNPLPCDNPLSIPKGKWNEGGRRRISCYALRLNDKSIATIEPKKCNYGNIKQLLKVIITAPKKIPKALNILLNYPKRTHPKELIPCGGHQWFILRKSTVKSILSFLSYNREYINYCRDTQILDEVFFSTLVYNLVDHSEIDNNILRYISWKDSNSPAVMTKEDLSTIENCIESNKILFLRKVEDPALLDIIDDKTVQNTKLSSN